MIEKIGFSLVETISPMTNFKEKFELFKWPENFRNFLSRFHNTGSREGKLFLPNTRSSKCKLNN